MTKAEDRVERSTKQLECSSAPCSCRLARAFKFVQAGFQAMFFELSQRYTNHRKRKLTLDKENKVTPKRNGMANSLERCTSILPGSFLLVPSMLPQFHVIGM